jgi:hypothetical protein
MPIKLDDPEVSSQLLALFPEIAMYYGSDVTLTLEAQVNANSGKFLTINKDRGIEIGKGDLTTISLMVHCSNSEVEEEFCVQFDMKVEALVNATMDNFYTYLKIVEAKVWDTRVTHDTIGMFDRNYDEFLSVIVDTAVENQNNEWEKAYDLEKYDVAFLLGRNMLTDTRVSPFIQDEFIYLGFTYVLDNQPIKQDDLNTKTQEIVEENSSTIDQIAKNLFEKARDKTQHVRSKSEQKRNRFNFKGE